MIINIRKKLLFWRKDEQGATAVEFALVGAPFILLVIGILEMSLMFTAQSLLEASTSSASRLVRTGQIQLGAGQIGFEEAICESAEILIPCDAIQYQVMPLDDFGAAEALPPASFDDEGNLENQGFDAGGVSDVILIRVAYRYPIMTPMMQILLTNNNDSSRLMISTVVLKTEPYQFEDEG